MFNITEGKIKKAQKVVLYGPEGIGKSTFASKFPDPLFIDTEGSTTHLDVKRFDKPTSWSLLLSMVKHVKDNPSMLKTLVIDTADWAEWLAIEHVCVSRGKSGLEDFGYGNGYTYLAEEFGRFLNLLTEVTEKGVNVLLLSHAHIRKFEQPDEMGAYDRWELKLQKKTAPLVKEWADAVLFANYKTLIVEDSKTKSKKAFGGQRVMYTCHTPAWDAKNRWGLDEMLDFSAEPVLPHLLTEEHVTKEEVKEEKAPAESKTVEESSTDSAIDPEPGFFFKEDSYYMLPNRIATIMFRRGEGTPANEEEFKQLIPISKDTYDNFNNFNFGVQHQQLADLMKANKVWPAEIERAVTEQGFFPEGTEIYGYPNDFIEQVLVANWAQVFETIKTNREKGDW